MLIRVSLGVLMSSGGKKKRKKDSNLMNISLPPPPRQTKIFECSCLMPMIMILKHPKMKNVQLNSFTSDVISRFHIVYRLAALTGFLPSAP